MFGDGVWKILPTSVVDPDDALLLRFTSCTLDVRHCFSRYVVNRFFPLFIFDRRFSNNNALPRINIGADVWSSRL